MRLAEPVASSWKASLSLAFARQGERSVLVGRAHDGPLVVQKPLYPESSDVCHAIVVHPPGGITRARHLPPRLGSPASSHALLTTPRAAKRNPPAGTALREPRHP